ncbi:M20/M25/M40 family metallo-hydrolase [bacterium]|nr:M20/M25/M40 family metallo-hydrolase [bacterium]
MAAQLKKLIHRSVFCILFWVNGGGAQTVALRPEIQSMVELVSADSLHRHVEILSRAGGYESRITFTNGNYAAAAYIAGCFESMPGMTRVVRDTFFINSANSPWNAYPIINIIGIKEGDSASEQIILLGGHYDSSCSHESDYGNQWNTRKARGADDNASGVAATLEIARLLCDPSSGYRNEATLKFIAFASEESHPEIPNISHAGSLYDAYHMKNGNEQLSAALILDMIAYNHVTDYIEVISNDASLDLANRTRLARDLYVPGLTMNSGPIDVPYSDHESYRIYGFQSALLMENDRPWNNDSPWYELNPYYHSSSDSLGTLNFTLMKKVTQTALATVAELAAPESSPSVTEMNAESHGEAYGAYPNPFNARTTIRVDLETAAFVNVAIFNSRGQEVAAVWDGRLDKGPHDLPWNADRMPAGLYFCRIISGVRNVVLKLALVK